MSRSFGVPQAARSEPEPPIKFEGHHVHDFDMSFPNSDFPMDYVLRCPCGLTARDMSEAIRLTNESRVSRLRDPRAWGAGVFLAVAASFFVWAMGRGLFW